MARTVAICDREAGERMAVYDRLDEKDLDADVVWPDTFEWGPDEIVDHAAEADVVVTALSNIDETVVGGLDDLSYIAKTGVGVDNIAVENATERGILVTRTPGVNDEGVAEHVIGMAITLNKRMLESDRELRAGNWAFRADVTGRNYELLDKTIGIVGLGTIGRRLAEIADAIGMDVLGYDPYVDAEVMAEHGAEKVNLVELLERSRYVSVNALLTDETRHMIDNDVFERMRDDAYLINTSRGPIVDEAALGEALREGEIAGAGLDVFEEEPPDPDNPLFDFDNVVVTPHISGTSYEGYMRIGEMASDDVVGFYEGRLPDESHVVNPDVLDDYDHPFE